MEHEIILTAGGPLEPDGRRMRILAAEDNPVFQSMLRNLLNKWGYEAIIARDGNEAWRILDSPDAPRLAVLDWMMPGLDGVDVCRRIRGANRDAYIYVLLLTARTESQDLLEAMDAGADDYLTKPFNAHELKARLRAGQRILDLQGELMAAREALRIQATHDSLTGLLNRGSVLDSLNTEISRAARARKPIAVLMADVDRFKSINDTWGHQAGDVVLRETAHRMQSAIRVYDAVGRYGGEEFLMVLPGCDAAGALAQAERIRDSIASQNIHAGGQSLNITCSLGASWRMDPIAGDAAEMIREADLALYRAKANGRNRVEVSDAVCAVSMRSQGPAATELDAEAQEPLDGILEIFAA